MWEFFKELVVWYNALFSAPLVLVFFFAIRRVTARGTMEDR